MLDLPIDAHLPTVLEAIGAHGGVVLVAEPGAGKTTRLPPALLDSGGLEDRKIVVVQPRRLAARMAAARIAEERGEKLGHTVGYRVRFDSRVGRHTRIELVTEGILARRLIADPTLAGVGAVIFDELHERHLDADVALARVRALQRSSRPTLRIVAMSATLDAGPVAAFLGVPVRAVEGRAHPVEVRHQETADDRPLERRVRAAVVRLLEASPEGDILVFLPGVGEIRRAMRELEGPASAFEVEVLPLHGDLPAEAQDRAVRRGRRRKVILSTNVAETSLTIDGVSAVVDSGLARVSRVSPWSGLSSLVTAPISRASAIQRCGRAGRTGPGVCVRLYTERDFAARPERDVPEVARADMTGTVLALLASGEDPRAFDWLEAPPASAIDAAIRTLGRLGALAGDGVSELGQALLRLPAHPRVARVAVEAHRRGHTESGAMAAALIAERDVRREHRTSLAGRSARGDEIADSDISTRLEQLQSLGPRAGGGVLRAEGLDVRTVQTVWRSARQIERGLDGLPRAPTLTFDEDEALRLAVLAGFPDRLARRLRGARLALTGGGVAELVSGSAVKEAGLLVAIDAVDQRGTIRVRRASAVTLDDIMELYIDDLEETAEVAFDAERERVVGRAQLRLHGLVVDETPHTPDARAAAEALAKVACARGAGAFCDAEALERLGQRLAFARSHDATLPALDQSRLEDLLTRLCEGRWSFAELRDADFLAWLKAELGADVLARLDHLAPSEVPIPGRSRVRVSYEAGRDPYIASRLQDFYGSVEGPKVAGGAAPLVLHLLAPNGRAVQVTTDLAGFWERHYPEVRKELRRRYAKHHWPDAPHAAEPRRLGRRRGR